MLSRNALFMSLVVLLVGGSSGCSTSDLKEYNPKMGFLDRLVQMEPANHLGERNRDYSNESLRGGRAVAVEDIKDTPLRWPLKNVTITSPFGQRGSEFHEGIDLRAKKGTPVYAAHSGQVLYAGNKIRGYGRMIVLKSTSGLATIYAHNSRLVVKKGQWVSQGSLLAYSGNTGHSTAPHLHFEVRNGTSAIDPMTVLPHRSLAGAKPISNDNYAENR